MGFFDKLGSFMASACERGANNYERAARSGRVGDRRLSDAQRQMAQNKADEMRAAAYRYRSNHPSSDD